MVKCAECGYLGVRRCNDQALVSPGPDQRRTGEAPKDPSVKIDAPPILETMPLCAIGVCPLDEEFADGQLITPSSARGPMKGANVAQKVMRDDRPKCESEKKFTPWIPGLSPKEHIDMNLLEIQASKQAIATRLTIISNLAAALIGGLIALLASRLSPSPQVIISPPQITVSPPQAVVVPSQPAASTPSPISQPALPHPSMPAKTP